MAVRNCADIGENFQKILRRLMANQKLVKLLYYTDKDPYNHPDLTQEQLENEVYNKLIQIIPRIGPKETAHTIISVRIANGSHLDSNDEFKEVNFAVEAMIPLTQWFIKDVQLRPFAILGEIENSLKGKEINGLGKIVGGDFALNFVTEEICCYQMYFSFISYE